MKDNSSKDILIKYFSTIKNHDNEIEELRKSLCNNKHFLPKNLFDSIDINLKSYLTLNDLRNYLNKNNIEFEEQCLRRFIHNFDKDEDFSIDYKEFLGIISPKKDDKLQNDIISKEPQENENNEIDSSSEKIFQEIIINEFNLIDIDEKNFISLNDLRIYLNKQFLPFEEQCLRRFIHNFSKDENFKINYRDFLGIILPKSNLSIANSIKNKNYSYDNQENKNDYIIENSFKKLIQLELNLVKALSQITEQLKNSKDFMIYEAFIAIVKFDK